ncbi:MAG: hydrogenobyrinic acid a,c-diamide synthase (glutamine-hydrolyzing) [Chromatiales bacterium]|jgi:cobyrinic acid a,c-diamide synthase
MAHFFISAAHKSSGKTTISIGLSAALARRGLALQTFKKGPDYIDPLWLSQASGRSCYNLDFFTASHAEIHTLFAAKMQGMDIGLIEGNKGLFDGMDVRGSDCNAALAKLLHAPVILVINTNGMTRGVAPLLLGYQQFDPELNIAGVILNSVGGARHEGKLVNVLEEYTDTPVVGSVWRNPALQIDERHLGLIPSNEAYRSDEVIDKIGSLVGEQVDLDRLLQLAETAPAPQAEPDSDRKPEVGAPLRVGIMQDAAFAFYYPDDLELMQRLGAELVPIDAIQDHQLPAIDALFIGGGFPETRMQELAANSALMMQIKDFIEKNGVVYAECGGLMYLSRSLTWGDKHCKMVGVIPGDTRMYERPQGRGYVKLAETDAMTWPRQDGAADTVYAHEFHHSALENLAEGAVFAYDVQRGSGIDGRHDGFIYKNLLANYAHMRNVGDNHWVERFLAHARQNKI